MSGPRAWGSSGGGGTLQPHAGDTTAAWAQLCHSGSHTGAQVVLPRAVPSSVRGVDSPVPRTVLGS